MSKMDSYGMEKPLFGEGKPKDRYINYILGLVAGVTVLATVISAFAHPFPPNGLHVFFVVVILLNTVSNCFLLNPWMRKRAMLGITYSLSKKEAVLIYWYREGDLDPKFRNLIYYNTLVTLLLCTVAFIIIFRS